MKKYTRITLQERENIYKLKQLGYNQIFIAKELNRNKSSISREIRRSNGDPIGYVPDRANAHASRFARRNPKLFRSANLRACVTSLLREGWSPEQIAGRMKHEGSDLRVSHETIYKFIYSEEAAHDKFYLLLTRRKAKRTKWHSRKPRKSHIPESAAISNRPSAIDSRKRIGHWEGDLVVFGAFKGANVTTMVERKSRFAHLVCNKNKSTDEVIGGIKQRLSSLPQQHCKTITFDRGMEFSSFRKLGVTTYFCNPHSPWQKGSNENFNGRLRRHLPKKYNPNNLSQNLLDKIAHNMNNTPRKCLGFKTPAEVIFKQKSSLVALGP